MRNFITEFGLALTLACCTTQAHAEAGRAAPDAGSLFVVNAHVFGNAKADAVHIQAGRIAAAGTRAEVGAAVPAEVTVLDAEGGVILPGLRDGHIHMLSGGLALTRLDLSACDSVAAVAEAVREYARSHPGEAWLLGRGWQYRIVSEGTFPTRQSLDRAVDDRPVLLTSYDGHCVWANSRALTRAGIAATTPDPAGGRIVREPDGKTPAGTLLESAADLALNAVPKPDRATQLDALNRAVQHCLSLGLTAVDDIDSDPEVLGLYGELLRTGRLPLRVTVSLPPLLPLVRETPPYKRTGSWASVNAPGPLETTAQERYYFVTLPDPSWPARQVEEHLQSFSRPALVNLSIHEAYPGHYTQSLWRQRAPSKVRQLLECDYPAGYVEPYPEFFAQLRRFAERVGDIHAEIQDDAQFSAMVLGSNAPPRPAWVSSFQPPPAPRAPHVP